MGEFAPGSTAMESLVLDLLVQGMIRLLEKDVIVKCRECDKDTVKKTFSVAEEKYASVIEKQTGVKRFCKLTLYEKRFLPDKCLGGVVLANTNGRIVANNTMYARLNIV